jgi:hypothetical protein
MVAHCLVLDVIYFAGTPDTHVEDVVVGMTGK